MFALWFVPAAAELRGIVIKINIDPDLISKEMREGADYGHIYSADTAHELVNSASRIYENSKELLEH